MTAYIVVNTILGRQLYLMDDFGSLTANFSQAKLYNSISAAKLCAKEYEHIFEVVISIVREV